MEEDVHNPETDAPADGWLQQYYTIDKTETASETASTGEFPDDEETRRPPVNLTQLPGDKYQKSDRVGEGGMKVIRRVTDRDASRAVAMATLHSSCLNQKAIRRFVHEARITAYLEHPNIVPVHDIGMDDAGHPYYTMKLLEGESLKAVLKKLRKGGKKYARKYTLSYMLEIFLKVCDAIAFAHSRGIVHLDLKPANVQVSDFGEVLVIDWGLAKFLDREEPDTEERKVITDERGDVTLHGSVLGTPGYMAPEQAKGENRSKDERTDIYALGALLYSLLTWCSPARGETVDDVLANTTSGNIVPPRERAPERNIPSAMEAVTLKAMSLDAQYRYRSVVELKEDILAFTGGFAPVAQEAGPATLFWLFVRRHKLVSTLVLTGLITTSSLVVSFVMRLQSKERYAVSALRKMELAKRERDEYGVLAAPGVLARAERRMASGDFDEAAEQLALTVTLDPSLRAAWWAKGYTHLAREEFKSAAEAFKTADVLDHGRSTGTPRKSTPREIADYYADLVRLEGRPLDHDEVIRLVSDIAALNRRTCKYRREILAHLIETRNREELAGSERSRFIEQALRLMNPMAESFKFRYVDGMDGASVVASGSADISDLTPLRGLRIASLDVSMTGVTDLRPVAGSGLKYLDISNTPVGDISMLSSDPLREVALRECTRFKFASLQRLADLERIIVSHNVPARELANAIRNKNIDVQYE